MLKALLCDFDGTIANTLGIYPKAYKKTLKYFGFNKNNEWIYKHCFGKIEEDICIELNIPEQTDKFRDIYLEAVFSLSTKIKLFEGVLDIFHYATKKNIKLAVISFAYRSYLINSIELLGIAKYFDIVIGHEDVKSPKPAPDAVYKVCKDLSITPSECKVIGDSRSDILMGNNAGTETVLFFPEIHKKVYKKNDLMQAKPDLVIKQWKDLVDYI